MSRKLLQPNVVYKRKEIFDSKLNPSLYISEGTINIYNANVDELGKDDPQSKNDMVIDEASPLSAGTYPIDTNTDFILYEIASGNPNSQKVISKNVVE
ncbi:MAG: hypothetical protein BV457_00135 [Thermoplasmata archaeon M9B1D]|nr:MAG: hypothetical protein BV457_00135 [Thermoplasmata archaeon M9B1D]PNX52227.1 MAG: hypothetical protein BV456_00160 [Thermoplasmata archaeon M8B2D]